MLIPCDENNYGSFLGFIGAHKYMLMSSSPVFWSMFNGALAVRNGESITITDVEYEAFGAMLRYVGI